MTPEASSAVTRELVERFAKTVADFINEVGKEVREAAMNPALSSTPALLKWQMQQLPLLEEQNASIQKGVALFQAGDTQTILSLADRMHGLDRQLDGFPLDFAGPQYAEVLDRLETAVIVAAYRLCAAARGR
jgi:uncharacterized protein CbrC (UPF0167 family)